MPAKPLDSIELCFLTVSNPSSPIHFLSPETTLPPYDEIHFLNNRFSTHVFVKCSTAVLSFSTYREI